MTFREAILLVMQEKQRPMHYKELTDIILSRGLCTTKGKTPDLTINAILTKSINKEVTASPFVKVDDQPGTYSLKNSMGLIDVHPDEVDEKVASHNEGAVRQVVVNAYERNPKAREECIKHYGLSCYVCEFNFSDHYGSDLGQGFIHVHHVYDISLVSDTYEVDPIKDLVPLCPNCHAMVHRERPAMHPDKLKRIVHKHNKAFKSDS